MPTVSRVPAGMPVVVPVISGVASLVRTLAPPVMSTVPRVSMTSSLLLRSLRLSGPLRLTVAVTL